MREEAEDAALREAFDDAFRAETAGALDTADRLYGDVLERAPDGPLKVRALLRRAHVQRSWGASAEAIRLAERGRAMARGLGDGTLEGECLNAQGAVHQVRGELDEAERLFRGVADLTDDPRVVGLSLQNLGTNAATQGRFNDARELFQRSSERFRQAGYRRGEAFALNNHGRVLLDQERPFEAMGLLESASNLAQAVGDLELRALAVLNLAEARLQTGEVAAAMECATQALGYFMAEENPWRVVECMRIQGDIAAASGEREEAERCYRLALATAEDVGARVEVEAVRERLERIGVRAGEDPSSHEEDV